MKRRHAAEERAFERAAIVQLLRRKADRMAADAYKSGGSDGARHAMLQSQTLRLAAEAVDRGEHREETL